MKHLRLVRQQLINSSCKTPQELVSYMGALQAQNYPMVKWAIGARIPNITAHAIEEAINQGSILRTHVLRPTWHLVAAQDIYDLLQLTAPRLLQVANSYGKQLGMGSDTYSKTNPLVRRCLEKASSHLTRPEIGKYMADKGFLLNNHQLTQVMFSAELAGIACSGMVKGKQQTYALLEQRVPNKPAYHRGEALEKLARKYFTSHGPASLADFVWWSGLTMKEAKQALDSIRKDILVDRKSGQEFWMMPQATLPKVPKTPQLHLLPAFDEYLVSYKNRDLVLSNLNYEQVITKNGIFRPTLVYDGAVIGTWSTVVKQGRSEVIPSFFDPNSSSELLSAYKKATDRFNSYIN